MAVELMMGYGFTGSATANTGSAAAAAAVTTTTTEENALEEAASAGIRSMEKLISLLSQQQQEEEKKKKPERVEMDCKAVADAAVTKFRKVISLLDRTSRTGHARFRRAPLVLSSPLPPPPPLQPTLLLKETKEEVKEEEEEERGEKKEEAVRIYCPKPIQQRLPPLPHHHQKSRIFTPSPPVSAVNSSYASSAMTGDTSSSAAFQASAGWPPLQSTGSCSLKRKCGSKSEEGAGAKHTGSGAPGRCHCSKRRKLRVKRTVRVPAISLKMADIPPDDFSWRKYGQKPIKGSPHPRGYYKCSSVRGCPARKHVERALDDPAMLVVTYEGDHSHTPSASDGAPPRLLLDSSS